jgi:uncharacterized protein involved in exopolysaccharide biosynthesis
MELINFFKVVGKRKWLILAIIVVAFVASFYSARNAKIPKETRTILNFSFSLPQAVDIGGEIQRYRIPIEQNAFDFVALFNTESVIRDGIENAGVEISPYAASLALNASVQVVKIGGEDERTSFIEVTCRHSDGDLAVKLVNGVTEAATERFVEMLTRNVTANREFLTNQVDEYTQRIAEHETKMRDFLETHPGFGQNADDQSIATRKVQLDFSKTNLSADVSAYDAKIRMAEQDLEDYKNGLTTNVPPAIKLNTNLQNLRNRVQELKLDRSEMLGRFSEIHPVILKLDSSILEAEQELSTEVVQLLEEEISLYKAQRSETSSQLGSVRGDSASLDNWVDDYAVERIEYIRILNDLRIDTDTYGKIKSKLSEAVFEENKAKQRYAVDIVERAVEAHARRELWFQPGFRIALAMIGSVFFALVLVMFIEYLSVKSGDTVTVESVPPASNGE